MSRTIRTLTPNMCLRHQSNRPHKLEKAILADLLDEDFDFPINFGNRPFSKRTPEPWDDTQVSGLMETKQQWKHDQLPRPKKRYR